MPMRCLKCGSSRVGPDGLNCVLCGKALGIRAEECYVSEDTKSKLLEHSEELKEFGVVLEPYKPLRKNVGAIDYVALALTVADSLDSGVLRKLVMFLYRIAVTDYDILGLRLAEPEEVMEILTAVRSDEPDYKKALKTLHPVAVKQNQNEVYAPGHVDWETVSCATCSEKFHIGPNRIYGSRQSREQCVRLLIMRLAHDHEKNLPHANSYEFPE